MKTGVCFIILAALLMSCEKGGNINHKVIYTTATATMKTTKSLEVNTYSGFGNYITSVTPTKFTAKLNIMSYQDTWDLQGDNTHQISYIDGHDNDPAYEIVLWADFSANQEVSVTPILYSKDIWKGTFKQREVTFDYFNFVPYFFYQEAELPGQYKDIQLQEFQGSGQVTSYDQSKDKVIVKDLSHPFINPIFASLGRTPFGFIFGNTDSTWIYNKECATMTPSPDFTFGGPIASPIIRSNKYTPVTVTMPEGGETIEMISTISFDTRNLIQIYAGRDNIPYTMDDVFVYAPNYWERLIVKLQVN